MNGVKKKILIITGRYLPGYKDGGPVRSIKNLTDYLGDEYEFRILTCDRDHGDLHPYANIHVNAWNTVGKARVYYVRPKGFTFSLIKKMAAQADLIYVCGCFNDYSIHSLILKRFGLIKRPLVVASMGLFSPMEFQLKYWKKKLFMIAFNLTGMFRNIYWSATSELEVSEIMKQVRTSRKQFYIAEDLPRLVDTTPIYKEKKTGTLRVVWISRIAPKKNLLQSIKILRQINSNIEFSIYGPKHDLKYWTQCERELKSLPSNIRWEWFGDLNSECVIEILKTHHIFLFPTLGENYGHVIQEALSAGCAVVLSDQTPWQDLKEYGAGYVIPIDQEEKFVKVVEHYAQMSQTEFQQVVDNALQYAIKVSNNKAQNTGYRKIFDTV